MVQATTVQNGLVSLFNMVIIDWYSLLRVGLVEIVFIRVRVIFRLRGYIRLIKGRAFLK